MKAAKGHGVTEDHHHCCENNDTKAAGPPASAVGASAIARHPFRKKSFG
jgi:hypothetical protein